MVSPVGFTDVSEVLQSGIYMLVKRGVPIYIGQSKRMLHRLYAHRTKGDKPSWHPIKSFVFDQIFIMPIHVDKLDQVEKEMIERYKPRYNQNLKSNAPATLPDNFLHRLAPVLATIGSPPAPVLERRV